ncbi:ferritin-like domain-containing protein [Fortiea contorta]|uniref:ferritin-like domain-containing protein n=1 Tax=Fortiea contorta TaxID=1892405 RepID=UPI0003492F95|nr:ferritin-like domain-containing protein [Fortiea contorta]
MSILNFPRLHFHGSARIHAPTGNKNGLADLSTNTVYMNGVPFDHRRSLSEFHKYLYDLGPRFNTQGEWDEKGPFSMAMGWDFGGNGHFAIDAKIISAQPEFGEIDHKDPIVGRSVEMWGHYNEYLGTSFNRARIFDCDPASNWTTTIMVGQLTCGRQGSSHQVPNLISAPVAGMQPARWQDFHHIRELPDHCLNSEFQRAAVHQFTISKTAADLLWGEESALSPTVSLLQEAMKCHHVLGLVVQFSLSNMSAPVQPDSPSFWELHGSIGLWCEGEMSTYPHGRLLTPSQDASAKKLSNLSVQVSSQGVSLNMVTAVPCVGRAMKPGPGPTHAIAAKLDLGELQLRTVSTQRLIARIPSQAYQLEAHQLTSGIVDVPLAAPWENLRDEIEHQGLCIVDAQGQILAQEKEINLQVDESCLFLEFPNWRTVSRKVDSATEVEIRSFVRGRPAPVEAVYLHQFYNPRALPHLRYKFEQDPANIGQTFHFPPSSELNILHFKPGKREEIDSFATTCVVSTNEQGRGWVTLHGIQPGTTRVLLSTEPVTSFQNDGDRWIQETQNRKWSEQLPSALGDHSHPDQAIIANDDNDLLGFWSGAGFFAIRVLPDDWHLQDIEDDAVDFNFIYEHILAYYELCFSFMKAEVFSLADRCKVETYARLMWQMCDPENRHKTYYMPPSRDLSQPKAMLLRKFLHNQQQLGYVPDSPALPKRTQRTIQTRDELVAALRHAAEIEIAVMLQYIYAAYSIPNYVTGEEYVRRGLWTQAQLHLACGNGQEGRDYGIRGVLLEISHEEMIHFLMVNNILMAMGEPFYAAVPNFSEINQHFPIDVDFALEPFSTATIQRFMRFEWPDFLEADLAADTDSNDPTANRLHGYGSLSELYRQIQAAIQNIPDLFIVKKGLVGGEHHLFLREDFNKLHPDYQLQVDDVESALFAINLIVEQGEGCNPNSPQFAQSHFQQYCRIAQALAQQHVSTTSTLPWNPAYPALRNPTLHYRDGNTNIVTIPETRAVMQIFDECYFLMMQLMVQHFGLTPTASFRRSKIMNAAIDVMTGMMRPLGELLVSMPSGKRGKTAGPSFEIAMPMYIPTPEVACEAIARRFQNLSQRAGECDAIHSTVTSMFDFYTKFFADLAKNPQRLLH